MSEANLWEWLRDVALPTGQYSRVETGSTAPGFPDVYCQLGPGISPTLELKFAKHPGSQIPFTKKTGMRRSQIKWIRNNLRNDGVVYIIAEVTPVIYIISGECADHINGATEEHLDLMARASILKSDPVNAAKILQQFLIEELKRD